MKSPARAGVTERLLAPGASGGAWAAALSGPAEFTWTLDLEEPRVVSIEARTHGVLPQIWTVDGRYRASIEPLSMESGLAWNPIITLPLPAGRHAVRALVARGAGVDVLRIVSHRSSDADYIAVLEGLGLPGHAPEAPVRRSQAEELLASPAFAELAAGLRLELAGRRHGSLDGSGRRRPGSAHLSDPVADAAGGALMRMTGTSPQSTMRVSRMRRSAAAGFASAALSCLLGALILGSWVGPAAAAEGEGGLFTWRPSLRVTAAANDNAFYEDSDAEGTLGAWIAPRLELSYRRPWLELGADLGVDFRRHVDHSSLGGELYRGVAWGEAALGRGATLRLSNAFVPQPVALGLPEDEANNLVQTNRSEADLRWWHGLSGGRELEIGVQGSYFFTEDYVELVPSPAGIVVDRDFHADYAQGLGFIEVQSPVGEATTAYVRTQGYYRSFSDVSSASHGNLSLLVGLRSGRWKGLDLDVAGGVGALSFDSFGDEIRALGRLSVRWRVGEGWILSLAGRHLTTPNLAGQEALDTTGELGVTKRFGSATEAALRFFVTRFEGDLRSSDTNLFGGTELTVRHQLTSQIQLQAGYRYWNNAGSLGIDDFSQNRLLLGVDFRL